jgi:PPOX class probable FMN-dependent enzyme
VLPDDTSFITDEVSLRKLHHEPMSRATDKVLRALDDHCRRIMSLSPFCVVATQGPSGADISPRGDPPGFVRELDARTLLLPDRVGNNRLDAMTNLLVNPRIGLLFLVPGMNETLRINGTARITDDARLLALSAIKWPSAESRFGHRDRGGVLALRQGSDPIRALG